MSDPMHNASCAGAHEMDLGQCLDQVSELMFFLSRVPEPDSTSSLLLIVVESPLFSLSGF